MTDLDQERADLNALVRESHEALTDMKKAIKDMDQRLDRATELKDQFNTVMKNFEDRCDMVIAENVADRCDAMATLAMESFKEAIAESIKESTEAVYERFDLIVNEILSGQDRSNGALAWGNMPLPEYLQSRRDS